MIPCFGQFCEMHSTSLLDLANIWLCNTEVGLSSH